MTGIRVDITQFVDAWQPGFVECTLVDAHGVVWTFVEKVPVVTLEDLDEHSDYPRPGFIACTIVSRQADANGRIIVRVDTSKPWDVEATNGETLFNVREEQIVDE